MNQVGPVRPGLLLKLLGRRTSLFGIKASWM